MSGSPNAQHLDVADVGQVRVLTISHGDRNALTSAVSRSLIAALDNVEADSSIRAVVITGSGAIFSAGADFGSGVESLHRELVADGSERSEWLEPIGAITHRLLGLSAASVVAINGDAVGGGATMTLGADLRIMSNKARIGFPFVNLGISPEGSSSDLLERLTGRTSAVELLLTGRLLSAEEALNRGIVSQMSPADSVLETAMNVAEQIAHRASPTSVALTKRLLNKSALASAAQARRAESDALRLMDAHPDSREGIAAFLERRIPEFEERIVSKKGLKK
jgi:enoyl-CoA hydratase/carnithine racemase